MKPKPLGVPKGTQNPVKLSPKTAPSPSKLEAIAKEECKCCC